MTPIEHGYANVNGIRIHYAESGSGDDLVILLHGFPEFWYSWRHQLTALGNRYHVVAPDMRGYNLSDKPPRVEDYRIDLLVQDVIGLIDHFGARKAAIVGHDWGAGVAWAVAQKYPERLSRLAILQVPPAAAWRANITPRQLLRSWYMFFFQLPRLPEWRISRKNSIALERVFKETVARKGTFRDSDIEAYKEALRQPGALTAAINYYRANVVRLISRGAGAKQARPQSGELNGVQRDAAHKHETQSRGGRIRVPTLFIFGEQDFAILPATVRGVEKYIDAPYREVRIADSGHWVQNEAAAEVNAALLDFLHSE
ncbi:MAG TPA: alpha/beta hydrolase [Pyrinomonadaceae bacterium]|jgi:pimeloyl-ACP methyl ester carboxylesterase